MDKIIVLITILFLIPLFCIDVSAQELDRSAFTTTIETQTADGVTEAETTPEDTADMSRTDCATIIYVLAIVLVFAVAFVGGVVAAGYLI